MTIETSVGRVIYLRVFLDPGLRLEFQDPSIPYLEDSPASLKNYLAIDSGLPYSEVKGRTRPISLYHYESGIDARKLLSILRFRGFKMSDMHISSDLTDSGNISYMVAVFTQGAAVKSRSIHWKKLHDMLDASFRSLEVKMQDLPGGGTVEWVTLGKRSDEIPGKLELIFENGWDLAKKLPRSIVDPLESRASA